MADALDIITLAEGYRAIHDETSAAAGTGNYDNVLTQIITATSRRIDDRCGPVVTRTISNELHNGGVHAFRPNKTPVESVTTLTEYLNTTSTTLTAETNATKPTDGYLLDDISTHNVHIRRRTSNADALFPAGRRNIDLTYQAGRYANTAAVDPKFKEAVASILRRMWAREGTSWSRGGDPFAEGGAGMVGFFRAIDPVIDEYLYDELYPPTVL